MNNDIFNLLGYVLYILHRNTIKMDNILAFFLHI